MHMNLLKQNECCEMFCCIVVSISIVLFSIFFSGVVYTDIAFMNNTYVFPLLLVVEEY